MDLLLAWFTKFNTLCSLERSQEDMFKSIVEESVFVKLWIGLRYVSSLSYALIYGHVCEGCGYIKNYNLNMK